MKWWEKLLGTAHRGDGDLLYNAVAVADIEEVKRLITQGADVNARNRFGDTPLRRAAYEGHTQVVELLINRGANVNTRNGSLGTALHGAAHAGVAEIAALLLNHGANVNARNKLGKTPLHYAVEARASEVVELLIKNRARVEARDKGGNTPLNYTASSGGLLERIGNTYRIANNIDGQIKCAELLIRHKADVNATNKAGYTTICVAVENGFTDLANLLRLASVEGRAAITPSFTLKLTSVFDSGGGLMVAGVLDGRRPQVGDELQVAGREGITDRVLDVTTLGEALTEVACSAGQVVHANSRSERQQCALLLENLEPGSVRVGETLESI
jgi:ankyrin repeat protein